MEKSKMFINNARESIISYNSVGSFELIELTDILGVLIGARANAEICGKLSAYRIDRIAEFSITELKEFGLSELEAQRVHAGSLLAKKIISSQKEKRYVIRSPEDAANYLMDEMRHLTQEHFVALYLNTKNEVLHKRTVFIGSLNASVVHPREIFNGAIRYSAASILVAHNHPSGTPDPSREDIEVTRRVKESGKILGVELLDHIIIGDRKY